MSQQRVLLVDGNPERATYIRNTLSFKTTANIAHRQDGESGVLWAGANECQLCIISYELSGIDGLETLARIRNRKPNLPAIMFSESTDQHVAIAAFREGVRDFVPARGNFGEIIAEIASKTIGEIVDSPDASQQVLNDPTLAHIPRERLAPTYQNRLRSIGRQLDIYGFHTITILEIEGGFIVRANRQRGRAPQALEFPDRDFPRLVASAIDSDADGEDRAFHQSNLTPTGYEDLLRALGYRLDAIVANSVVISELNEMFVVSGRGNDETSAVPGLMPFNWFYYASDVEFMLNEAFKRRGKGESKAPGPAKEPSGIRGIFKRLN